MTSPLLEWTTRVPWASVRELAAFAGVDRSTASRQVASLMESGHLAATNGGRLLRPRDRVLTSSIGLAEIFPQRHSHSSDGIHYYHDHHPFHPEWEDHARPGFFNSHSGAELLWSRLDFIEIAYSFAPAALMGEGARWTHDGRPRRLISWRWLRHTRFVQAVATYEDGYILFFCWVGRSVTAPMLQAQYDSRFARFGDLEMSSAAEDEERRRDWLFDQRDDNYDASPQPSGWVIITPNFRGGGGGGHR